MNLDAIKRRLAAATPGPWGLQGAQNDYEIVGPGPSVNTWCTGPRVMEISLWNKHPSPADVDLIVHAPGDLAALIAEVEGLRADLDALSRAVGQALVAASLAVGETLSDPIPHAIVSTTMRMRAEVLGQRAEAIRAAVDAERAAVVAWLRSESFIMEYRSKRNLGRHMADVAADFIERGEHRREEE